MERSQTKRADAIIVPMERMIDEICVVLMSAVFAVLSGDQSFGILGFLASIILICAWECSRNALGGRRGEVVRAGLICAFCACALFTPVLFFLPVAAYLGLHERAKPVRILFAAPLIVHAAQTGAIEPQWMVCCVGCAVAALLAVRDVREASERSGLRFAFDDAREENLQMRVRLASDEDRAGKQETSEIRNRAFERLSKRELAIAKLVAEGKDNREIASELFLSEGTVRNHVSSILSKMELANRTQIAIAFYR